MDQLRGAMLGWAGLAWHGLAWPGLAWPGLGRPTKRLHFVCKSVAKTDTFSPNSHALLNGEIS